MLKKIAPALYVILDTATLKKRDFFGVCRRIISARPTLVQLRDKQGEGGQVLGACLKLKALCKAKKVKFIINDRLDMVLLADGDGVHLGQGDISVSAARKLLGKNRIIGVSCHSLSQALRAQREGADYISIGPVFSTPTKPEYPAVGLRLVSQARQKIKIPFFAIGDIRLSNLNKILSAGAENIAVCREACLAKDPAKAVKKLKAKLGAN